MGLCEQVKEEIWPGSFLNGMLWAVMVRKDLLTRIKKASIKNSLIYAFTQMQDTAFDTFLLLFLINFPGKFTFTSHLQTLECFISYCCLVLFDINSLSSQVSFIVAYSLNNLWKI